MAFNRVNPPKQITLPRKIEQDQELKKFFDELLFNFFQLWKRTGAGEDWVDDSRQGEYEFDDLTSLFASLSPNNPDVAVTNTDYTTVTSQVVVCNDALTVFLNETPEDREVATIKITNGDVTINAGSKQVDKQDFITVIFDDLQGLATIDVVYLLETDEWFIV